MDDGTGITNYLWDEFTAYGDVVLESDGLNTPQLSYTMAAGQLISQTNHDTVNAGTHYYLGDIQGSTYELIDENGVIESYRYDAFGELLEQPSGDLTTDYLYTGEHYDALTESYNLRARHYMPGLGRFTGRDPHPYNLNNPFELNRYVYTANNPVMFSDPSGLYVGTRSLGGISAGAAPAAKSTGITITISYEHLVLALGAVAMPNLDDLFDDPTREKEKEKEIKEKEKVEEGNRGAEYNKDAKQEFKPELKSEQLPQEEGLPVPPVVDVDVEEDEEEDELIDYLHVSTEKSIDNIMTNGIQPRPGYTNPAETNFYAFTFMRGPHPRPTREEAFIMLDVARNQVKQRYPGEPLAFVVVRIPSSVVDKLEVNRGIYYQSYFKTRRGGQLSGDQWKESVINMSAFPIVNQYRHLWQKVTLS